VKSQRMRWRFHHPHLCMIDEDALPTFDKKTVGRLKSIQQLDEENKGHVFAILDAFLLKCSIQNNLASPK